MKEPVQMQAILPSLYVSAPKRLPFDSSLEIRSFLLQRNRGNLLIYSGDTLASDAPAVRDLGGIARWYMNHWHESMVASDRIAAPLYCHEKDRKSVAKKVRVYETFVSRLGWMTTSK